jgi:hypothetical protein
MFCRNSIKTHWMQQGEKSTLFLFGKVWNLSGLVGLKYRAPFPALTPAILYFLWP